MIHAFKIILQTYAEFIYDVCGVEIVIGIFFTLLRRIAMSKTIITSVYSHSYPESMNS